jgi:2-oxoglutarate ferredoxin oxidoreductase subunit beta
MPTRKDLDGRQPSTWCPGCGNFGILNAYKLAMVEMGLEPWQALMVTGIGQGSKTPQYMMINGMHTIHGRDMAYATGAHLANHELTMLTASGDGNTYGMGLSHLIHTMRRNVNLCALVQNNQVYGLTKGQYSPTSDPGMITPTSPRPTGAIEKPIMPLAIAITAGATFVARGFSKDVRELAELIIQGIRHKGFALIDCLQPCVTFNHINTFDWYAERVYRVEKEEGYDPTDKNKALLQSFEWGDRIPTGVLYQVEEATYADYLPALKKGTLVQQGTQRDRASLEALKEDFT